MTPEDEKRHAAIIAPTHTPEEWAELSIQQARSIDSLNQRVGHWMKRCERAEKEVMRLLREREAAK